MKKLSAYICIVLISAFIIAQPALAQQYSPMHPEEENLKVPDGWEVRLDKPDESVTIGADSQNADIYFVNMSPGWHITTGPRAIFYRPEVTASGNYMVSTTIHLFDPEGRNEAFGLFIGGKQLQASDQSYTYFLIRNSGEYLIKKRIGADTRVVKDWTKAPSMVQYQDTTESSVSNTLTVRAEDNTVSFFVNGEKVDELSRDGLDTEGIVGLRVNHRLNLHVQFLGLEEI